MSYMSKNQKNIYRKIFITIFLGVIIIFFLTWRKNPKVTTPIIEITANTDSATPSLKLKSEIETQTTKSVTEQKTESPKNIEENNQSVTILAGGTTVYLSFLPNTIFYDALVQGKNENKISFSGKNYPGLGFFVTDIGTLHAGSGKHLLYYINGKEATVGVSSYTLKDGNIIEWKLE